MEVVLVCIVVRKVNGLELAVSRLFKHLQLRIMVANPRDRDVGILIDATSLFEELLYFRQRVESSGRARGDDADPFRVGRNE